MINKQAIIVFEGEQVGLGSTIFRGLHRLYYKKPEEILYFEFRNKLYGNKNTWSTYLLQPFIEEKDFILNSQENKTIKSEYGVFSNPHNKFFFGYGKAQNNGADFLNYDKVKEYREFSKKYLRFLPKIIEKAEAFFDENLKNYKTLSLHRRGTDLFLLGRGHAGKSAHLFTDEYVIQELLNVEKDYDKIFLATDDGLFFNKVYELLGNKIVSYSKLRSLGSSQNGLHFQHINSDENIKYTLGEEVLIDSMIMSKCNFSLTVRSNISLISILLRHDSNYKFIDNHVDYGDLG